MHSFLVVVVVVGALGILGALFTFFRSESGWAGYGGQMLTVDSEPDPSAAETTVERDAEIRQLLEARNAVRAHRGGEVVDVDDEFQRLTRPAVDPDVEDELRQLITAQNYRRTEKGLPPLDVEAELQRRLADLAAQ